MAKQYRNLDLGSFPGGSHGRERKMRTLHEQTLRKGGVADDGRI